MPSLDEPDPPDTEFWTMRSDHVLQIWEALLIGLACGQRMRVTEREIDLMTTAIMRLRDTFPENQPGL